MEKATKGHCKKGALKISSAEGQPPFNIVNQSINQLSISQSINQLIKQSINQLIKQSINCPLREPVHNIGHALTKNSDGKRSIEILHNLTFKIKDK